MRRAAAIAWKDLKSVYQQPSALVLMFALPLGLALLLGLAFGGGGNFSLDPIQTALFVPQETSSGPATMSEAADSSAAAAVVETMTSPGLHKLLAVRRVAAAEEARRLVDEGEVAVAVIVPPGFDAAARGGGTAAVEVYADPAHQIGAGIVSAVVRQLVAELGNAAAAARTAAAVTVRAHPEAADAGGLVTAAAVAAAHRYADEASAERLVTVRERAPRLAGAEAAKDPGVTGQVLAGMMVFFLFFGAANAARTILVEQQQGTLQRLFTTPSRRAEILGGKFLVSFLTVLVQAIVLLLVGWLAFRIDWGALGPVAVLIFATCAVASGLAMLVGSLSRTLAQEGAIGSGVYVVLGLIGGNFIGGAVQMEGAARVLRRLTPNGWLLEGWDAAMRGGGLSDVALPVLIALGFAAVFFALAVAGLRRRFA